MISWIALHCRVERSGQSGTACPRRVLLWSNGKKQRFPTAGSPLRFVRTIKRRRRGSGQGRSESKEAWRKTPRRW